MTATDPLAPVYAWLADTLAFPVDMCCPEKPAWLDMRGLAAAWLERDRREGRVDSDATVESHVRWLFAETGWDDGAAHDETCCMNGVAPASGPHPDCPGAGGVR